MTKEDSMYVCPLCQDKYYTNLGHHCRFAGPNDPQILHRPAALYDLLERRMKKLAAFENAGLDKLLRGVDTTGWGTPTREEYDDSRKATDQLFAASEGQLQSPRALGDYVCPVPSCKMIMPMADRYTHELNHTNEEHQSASMIGKGANLLNRSFNIYRDKDAQQSTVNHPGHYGGDTVYETIKVLKAWLSPAEYIGFLKGNVIKYLSRAEKKAGREDYHKATWYQQELDKVKQEEALREKGVALQAAGSGINVTGGATRG